MLVIPEGVENIYGRQNSTISSIAAHQPQAATISGSWPALTKRNEWTSEQTNSLARKIKREPTTDHEEIEGSKHQVIGLSLIMGFAVMFSMDQTRSTKYKVGYTELETVNALDEENEDLIHDRRTNSERYSMTPIVGLTACAAAIGIGLGVSASHPQLSMIVFISIMRYNLPVSYAFASSLLASGLLRTSIRKHLLMFALATPLGAFLAYFALDFLHYHRFGQQTLNKWQANYCFSLVALFFIPLWNLYKSLQHIVMIITMK